MVCTVARSATKSKISDVLKQLSLQLLFEQIGQALEDVLRDELLPMHEYADQKGKTINALESLACNDSDMTVDS